MNVNAYTVMKSTLAIALITAAAAAWAQQVPEGVSNEEEDESPLGEREWPPVTNGIVFVDWKYLPPPYTVSRSEGNILVNGQLLLRLLPWPPLKIPPLPPPPETEPIMPTSITEKTSEYDREMGLYTSEMADYFRAKHGQEKATEMMVDVYRRLPCVKSAQRRNSRSIEVIWMNGKKDNISQAPPPRRAEEKWTKEQVKETVDRISQGLVERFTDGGFYMAENGGPCRSGTIVGARQTFLPLADAMRTAENEEDFLAIMKTNHSSGGMPERQLRIFYKHKDEMPEWEARVRALTSPDGQ